MKPIIFKAHHSWFCGTTKLSDDFGVGGTPAAAYQMWMRGGWFKMDRWLYKGKP